MRHEQFSYTESDHEWAIFRKNNGCLILIYGTCQHRAAEPKASARVKWCVFEQLCRTVIATHYHNWMDSRIHRTHLNIWRFIQFMLVEEKRLEDVQTRSLTGVVKRRNTHATGKENRINTLQELNYRGLIDTTNLLSGLSHLVESTVKMHWIIGNWLCGVHVHLNPIRLSTPAPLWKPVSSASELFRHEINLSNLWCKYDAGLNTKGIRSFDFFVRLALFTFRWDLVSAFFAYLDICIIDVFVPQVLTLNVLTDRQGHLPTLFYYRHSSFRPSASSPKMLSCSNTKSVWSNDETWISLRRRHHTQSLIVFKMHRTLIIFFVKTEWRTKMTAWVCLS